jgi:hypothetical protein
MAPQGGDPVRDYTGVCVDGRARLDGHTGSTHIPRRDTEPTPERAAEMRLAGKTMAEHELADASSFAGAGRKDRAAAIETPAQDIGSDAAFVLEQAIERRAEVPAELLIARLRRRGRQATRGYPVTRTNANSSDIRTTIAPVATTSRSANRRRTVMSPQTKL